MPLNAALNPYLYSFSTKPVRIHVDDLLANWQGEPEAEEEEEEDGEKGETELRDTSVGGSTTVSSSKGDTAVTSAEGSSTGQLQKY